jgi:hypothetical protein
MGSSFAGTALDSSDIDLYAPMPNQCGSLGELRERLAGRATYRKTRPGPTGEDRHLFSYTEGATRVDLNFVPPSDYRLARTGRGGGIRPVEDHDATPYVPDAEGAHSVRGSRPHRLVRRLSGKSGPLASLLLFPVSTVRPMTARG